MFFVALSLLSCEVLPVGKHMLVRASSCWIMLFRLLIICSRCRLDSLDISRLRVGAHYYSPLDLKIKEAAFSSGFSGGTWRIRTAVPGFADRSLTARARYHFEIGCKGTTKNAHVQIFFKKNEFLPQKSAHLSHFPTQTSNLRHPKCRIFVFQ